MEVSGETFPYPHVAEENAENETETMSNDKTNDYPSLYVSSKHNSPDKVVKQIADCVSKSPHYLECEMIAKNRTTNGSPSYVPSTHKTIPLPQPLHMMAECAEDSESDALSDIVPITVSIFVMMHSILKLY